MIFCTTMNVRVFLDFGYRLLESFEKFSEPSDRLVIITEDAGLHRVIKEALDFERCEVHSFCDPDVINFISEFRTKKKYRGARSFLSAHTLNRVRRILRQKKVVGAANYDFTRDVYRFCFKPFAISQTILSFYEENLNDLICYVDADCNFLSGTGGISSLRELSEVDIGYFGRETFTETGVMFFRLTPEVKCFVVAWTKLYFTNQFKALGGWTDCHTFDFCRVNSREKISFVNLNNLNEPHHPIAKSCLRKLIDHRKGDRKPMQSSPEIHSV